MTKQYVNVSDERSKSISGASIVFRSVTEMPETQTSLLASTCEGQNSFVFGGRNVAIFPFQTFIGGDGYIILCRAKPLQKRLHIAVKKSSLSQRTTRSPMM